MTEPSAQFLERCLLVAFEAAEAARDVTSRYFRSALAVDSKSDESPVTKADREAELAARAVFGKHFPEHGVIGEEFEPKDPDAEFTWIVDPIDGTKQFVTGNVGFGSLFALAQDGRPLLGLIDMPMKHERWWGAKGLGAYLRDHRGEERARVRPCAALPEAILTSTSPAMFKTPERLAAFDALARQTRFTVYGNDCYGFGLLASGFLDLACEADLGVYDFMALSPIVTEAGGIITNWRGEPVGLGSGDTVLAAGDARCHEAALSLLGASA
jgi:inositol-phosphate phosphatase/L-galactose 1-phosphate phosphatase/histidinol-phosphatase